MNADLHSDFLSAFICGEGPRAKNDRLLRCCSLPFLNNHKLVWLDVRDRLFLIARPRDFEIERHSFFRFP